MEGMNVLLDLFSEDVMLRMCLFLPGQTLMNLSISCKPLRPHTHDSHVLWHSLCDGLLGEALVDLHRDAWATAAVARGGTDSVTFLRALFKSAFTCESFSYSIRTRRQCIHGPRLSSVRGPDIAEGSQDDHPLVEEADQLASRKAYLNEVLTTSGPSSCTTGHVVVNIGGSRRERTEDKLHVCIVDLVAKQIVVPRLAQGSARPGRRTRHASCVIQPSWLPKRENGLSPILVLGGCNDTTSEPCSGLNDLLILEITGADTSEIHWREERAEGEVPNAIWHHICGSFAKGKKVVVFGGDIPQDDSEYPYIADREHARHIYLLHVDDRRWDRIITSGSAPIWRSLHKGVTYNSLADASDRLVIVGGSVDHVPLHGQGRLADMAGYSLNLGTFEWQRGTYTLDNEMEDLMPSPRMRFAADRYGRYLLIYGGHLVTTGDGPGPGPYMIRDSHQVLKMDLITLRWSGVRIKNRPHSFEYIPGASLCSGVLFGGFTIGMFGVQLVPKLDFICLSPPADRQDAYSDDGEASSDDPDLHDMINVQIRNPDGHQQRTLMPRSVFRQMVQRGIFGGGGAGIDDDNDNAID